MLGLTKTAAIEYAKQGLRINSIGPGFIDTPLLSKNLSADALGYIAGLHPIGRLGTSEEVATLPPSCSRARRASSPAATTSSMAATRRSS